ncbi:MAG TPA: 3-deoxy-D-manno-octulosonic acid kinase [Steroidobacteraceae bacterium]|nr:3-deoxy-D-manno-octulosonic acid kinase [Steroidobacteraceae bacterium]
MNRKWPLGSEVRRKVIAGGAMLYDASRAGNLSTESFDPVLLARRGQIVGEARGRGKAWFLSVQNHAWVLRHYRRGGLISGLSHDRYWWRGEEGTRSFAEWQLTYHLHRAGLPVPAPIAARYRKHGFGYRGDIITERLADVWSLAQALDAAPLSLLTWIAIGRCLRRFHELGVCHADLNAHNILIGQSVNRSEDPHERIYLIDFDRGSLRKPGFWQDANLVRLRRSLEKVTWGLSAERFTEDDWHGLLDGYQQPPTPQVS